MSESKDYCISLEMAQRPEMHAAMLAAGCKQTSRDWRWLRLFADSEWKLTYSNPFRVVPFADVPAYHLGELWVAAVKFMPEGSGLSLAHRGQPRSLAEPVMASCGNAGGECATSAHAPDALAELVIALHAAQNLHSNASEGRDD